MQQSPKFSIADALTEIRTLWATSWPVLVGQIALVGMGAADVIMSGHFSSAALAAVSVGTSVWIIAVVTAMGIMMAVNSIVAHEVGAANHAGIAAIVRQSLWKSLAVGVIAVALLNLSTRWLDPLQLSAELEQNAATFVHVISIGMIPFCLFRVLYGYCAALDQTRPLMVIALGSLVFNIFVNWIFIYGHFGLPALGGVGCAVGTDLGLVAALIAIVVWVAVAPAYRETHPFGRFEPPRVGEIAAQLRIGLPIGVTYFAESSTFSLIGLLVARFGVVTIAGHQIALNFASLIFMVPMSLGMALITRIGHLLGAGNAQRARSVAFLGVAISVIFGLLSALFIAGFRDVIGAVYTSDPAVQHRAAQLLVFAALFQLSDSTQVTAASAVRGYKVTRLPMLIHLTAFWIIVLPLGCVLGLAPKWIPFAPAVPMQAEGFWLALVFGLTVAALALVWCLDRISRKPDLRSTAAGAMPLDALS